MEQTKEWEKKDLMEVRGMTSKMMQLQKDKSKVNASEKHSGDFVQVKKEREKKMIRDIIWKKKTAWCLASLQGPVERFFYFLY